MNRNEIIDVLTAVAAGTRRTIGQADVEVWGAVIGHLDKQSALDAVATHFRESPGVWLEPGHVVANARAKMRDLQQRAPIQLGPKLQEGPVRSAYAEVNALAVDCPACEAPQGDFCRRADGSSRRIPCPKRIPHRDVSDE